MQLKVFYFVWLSKMILVILLVVYLFAALGAGFYGAILSAKERGGKSG